MEANTSKRQAWIMAIRPKTLPAAAAAVIVGIALAAHDGVFALLPALAALLVAELLQIASNLANDVFDFERGVDRGERLGPTRVTQSGLLSPGEVRKGLWLTIGLAVIPGLYLATRIGWTAIWIGLAAIIALLAYTGGPFPYGSYALGDLFVFIFFGLVSVGGTYLVQAGTLQPAVWWMGAAMGLLITNILVVNNYRDRPTDSQNGKKTLAVLLGERGTQLEYLLCMLGAFLIPLTIWLHSGAYRGGLLTWVLIPKGWQLFRELQSTHGRALNHTLAATAQFGLLYALVFSLGILLFP